MNKTVVTPVAIVTLGVSVDTVMIRAIEGNKPIEAENARHICG